MYVIEYKIVQGFIASDLKSGKMMSQTVTVIRGSLSLIIIINQETSP
jgi:hypothetical protein